jgi:hypothetical protein
MLNPGQLDMVPCVHIGPAQHIARCADSQSLTANEFDPDVRQWMWLEFRCLVGYTCRLLLAARIARASGSMCILCWFVQMHSSSCSMPEVLAVVLYIGCRM